MTMKFLQINLGRGREAQDLMIQKATEDNKDILLISEPYRRPSSQVWYEDTNHRAAIMVRNRRLIMREVNESNAGFVYVTVGKIRVYSCYYSPQMDFNGFTEALNVLDASIRSSKYRVVIGGDFNSKSPEWNSNQLDNKGTAVCEMIASLGLTIFNIGDKLTFRRGASGSIIDITFGATSFYNGNMNWLVLEDLTLSDHQYITFNIDNHHNITQDEVDLPKWNVRKLDEEKMSEYILRAKGRNMNTNNSTDFMNTERVAESLTRTLTKACNVGMPRVQKYNNKRPVYWWTEEIRELRAKCLAARRASTRNHNDLALKYEYKRSRKSLRKAIKNSKRKCWTALCNEIDTDPWGKPYKIAVKKLGGIKPIPGIKEPAWATTIVETLFPFDVDGLICGSKLQVEDFFELNVDDLRRACNRLSMGKSPGPDGIPNEVIKLVSEIWPEYFLKVFNSCLLNGIFPTKWKIQRLVLLRKGDKPLNDPSSYRPLCMLDSLGKLLECLMLRRLEERIDDLGGLSPMQHGFRKGKSTIDAISEVVNIATQAKMLGGYCAIITLDIKNAFNTVKWEVVLEAFRNKGVDGYLYNIVADYLDNRILLYETENGMKEYRITAGVPQGSVLGPFLWNVMYDGLLNLVLQEGAKLVGYADDIALVIHQQTAELIEIIANDSLSRCNRWLWRNGLQLAVPKTEAILVTNRRVFRPPILRLQDSDITLKRSLCYLGVQLDDTLSFRQHVQNIRDKALRTATSLARIMPNCGGPKPYIRKLINSVVHSQLLYAAPTFTRALNIKCNIRELQKPQRVSALRTISAYRTVSTSAALVLAGLPPIDLLILEREEIYIRTKFIDRDNNNPLERKRQVAEIRSNARDKIIAAWQERWDQEETGRWTYNLIPNIRVWIERKHGSMGYFLTQALTDHGSFNKYLKRFKLKDSSSCDSCGALEENAKHILFECEKWLEERQALNEKMGVNLTPENIVCIMLSSESSWKWCEQYINRVIKERCSVVPNLLT